MNNLHTFPFRYEHFRKFSYELKSAGSFDALMLKKQALKRQSGMKYITLYYNKEEYKRKFLTGAYLSLRPMYDTEMPYLFWSDLQAMLLKMKAKNV